MEVTRIDIHNHTRYSNQRLRDALATPEGLIDRAIKIGLKGVAITDHETVAAHIKANKHAQKIAKENPDFKVILGNEIYLVNERPADIHYHFILLAKDKIGHRQLRRLSTLAWLNCYNTKGMTRVDTLMSDLEWIVGEEPGHLIGSSACIGGRIGQSLLAIEQAKATENFYKADEIFRDLINFIDWCKKVFRDDFYLEVQPGISEDQKLVNKKIRELSKIVDLKIVPSSDTHYLKKEDRYVHKAFLNSENKEREVDAFYQDTYLHTNEEMIEKFAQSGFEKEFVEEMFRNSLEIYDKIENYSLLHHIVIPEVDVDYFDIEQPPKEIEEYEHLSKMYASENKVNRYWIHTCIDKMHELDIFNKEHLEQLNEEARVKQIVSEKVGSNMFQYPITMAHYIDMIWDCGSTVAPGRGSATAMLNHYLLGITQINPVTWNLPSYRYMNEGTEEPGDIDIDVCSSKVHKILNKMKEERKQKFIDGLTDIERDNLGAVYVCTYGTESAKSSVITSARGYRSIDFPEGIDVDTAQYMSSLIRVHRGFVEPIKECYYGDKGKGKKPVNAFKKEVDQYPGLLDIMLGIEGLISRRGRHASGVLLTGEDPYEFNAYMRTPSGEVVTQYDLHDAEAAGSQKIDLLVTQIQDKLVQTLEYLKKR